MYKQQKLPSESVHGKRGVCQDPHTQLEFYGAKAHPLLYQHAHPMHNYR